MKDSSITGSPQNKMQAAQGKGTCHVCRGAKCVKGTDGKTLTCHACRGTGSVSGYSTK